MTSHDTDRYREALEEIAGISGYTEAGVIAREALGCPGYTQTYRMVPASKITPTTTTSFWRKLFKERPLSD
jgi:hypothetical protein